MNGERRDDIKLKFSIMGKYIAVLLLAENMLSVETYDHMQFQQSTPRETFSLVSWGKALAVT